MKVLTTSLVLVLAVAFGSPVLAASDPVKAGHHKSTLATAETYKAPTHKKAMKGMSESGIVSDIPRNRPECKKVGGTWDDQTNTCNEKKKM
jgi:hypothetical protein